jgi:hypothetical protein
MLHGDRRKRLDGMRTMMMFFWILAPRRPVQTHKIIIIIAILTTVITSNLTNENKFGEEG